MFLTFLLGLTLGHVYNVTFLMLAQTIVGKTIMKQANTFMFQM